MLKFTGKIFYFELWRTKMKKIISLVLVLTMVLTFTLLTACGDKSDEGSESGLTVTVVVADTFGDKSFYDSAKEGLDKLEKDCGITAKTIECSGENFEQQMRTAADGSDFVVPVGFQFDMIADVAADYPDVKFIWCDNEAETKLDNLLCVTYAQNEGSFLAGYIAAKLSKTGTVGAVGGMENPTINDFLVGYKAGAEYANKDIKVETNYAGDFNDPAKGKEAATSLNSKGADVIFQVAGNTGSGVFEAAKENNFYAIGVDGDQKHLDPDHIVCSMVKNVGLSIYTVIKDYIDDEGSWEGSRTWVADMSTGFIDISYGEDGTTQQVSDDLKKEVEQLKQDIIDGKVEVPTAR